MLVLSRRVDEKIVLPTVPAVIKLIAAQAGLARLGIEAPSRIPILREELLETSAEVTDAAPSPPGPGEPRHGLCQRLNNLTLGLALLRLRLRDQDEALTRNLRGLEQEVEGLWRGLAELVPGFPPVQQPTLATESVV